MHIIYSASLVLGTLYLAYRNTLHWLTALCVARLLFFNMVVWKLYLWLCVCMFLYVILRDVCLQFHIHCNFATLDFITGHNETGTKWPNRHGKNILCHSRLVCVFLNGSHYMKGFVMFNDKFVSQIRLAKISTLKLSLCLKLYYKMKCTFLIGFINCFCFLSPLFF